MKAWKALKNRNQYFRIKRKEIEKDKEEEQNEVRFI